MNVQLLTICDLQISFGRIYYSMNNFKIYLINIVYMYIVNEEHLVCYRCRIAYLILRVAVCICHNHVMGDVQNTVGVLTF